MFSGTERCSAAQRPARKQKFQSPGCPGEPQEGIFSSILQFDTKMLNGIQSLLRPLRFFLICKVGVILKPDQSVVSM